MADGLAAGGTVPVSFAPESPNLLIVFALSPHSVTPTAYGSDPDSVIWDASGISSGFVVQEQ